MQNKILENSPLHKELIHLANQNKPRNNKPLITDKQWKLIADEITYIYPNLRKYYIVDAQIYQSKTFGIAVYIYQGLTLTQKQSY